MHIEQKYEMRILTEARKRIDANHAVAHELSDGERERRVVEYARQVAEHGAIVAWLPPARPRAAYLSRRSRFASGDALGRHRAG